MNHLKTFNVFNELRTSFNVLSKKNGIGSCLNGLLFLMLGTVHFGNDNLLKLSDKVKMAVIYFVMQWEQHKRYSIRSKYYSASTSDLWS